jgi:hypothetical protein
MVAIIKQVKKSILTGSIKNFRENFPRPAGVFLYPHRNPTMIPAQKQKLAIEIVMAVAETIREAGEIPSGHLYAGLMEKGCTLAQYDNLIRTLIESGIVRKSGHMLKWAI